MRSHPFPVLGLALALTLAVGCQNPTSGGATVPAASPPSSSPPTSSPPVDTPPSEPPPPQPSAAHWTAGGLLPQSGYWNSVAFGNGVFVAVGDTHGDNAATSTDGLTWTSHAMPRSGNASRPWSKVTFGDGKFVALAPLTSVQDGEGTTTLPTMAAVSTDGVTWTSRSLTVAASWSGLTWFSGRFYALSTAHAILSSSDGLTWSVVDGGFPAASWYALASGGGRLVVMGAGQSVVFDGTTWTTSEASAFPFEGFQALGYIQNTFVALGNGSSQAYTSPDGLVWTARDLPGTTDFPSVTVGYATLVAVDSLDTTLTSTDGTTWETQSMDPTKTDWSSVAAGNGRFVAIPVFGNATSVSH